MSAHKRALITPDSAALRRLEALSAQLRVTTRPDPVMLTAARQQTQVELKQAAVHTQKRQESLSNRLDEHLSGIDARLADLARETEVALSSQSQQMQAIAMQRASQGLLASQVESLIDQQAEQLFNLLDQTQAAHQADLEGFTTQLQGQQRHMRSARQAAVGALHQSQALLEALQQVSPNHPSLGGLQSSLEQAQENLGQGHAEAALASAQQTSYQLQEVRINLERELNERILLRAATLEKLSDVYALLAANQEVSAVDMEGRTLDYPLNVDFWTEGGWTRQVQALTPIQDYLAYPAESLAPVDLRHLLDQALPQIEQSLPDLVAQARRAVLASQLRFNMAEAVLAALGEQGFVPAQASYQDGDMRQAYQLALNNLEGSHLVVTLEPQPEGMQNQLDLHSQDALQRTPHELRQRARELARSLRRYGLQVHNPAPLALREAPASYRTSLQPTTLSHSQVPARPTLPVNRGH